MELAKLFYPQSVAMVGASTKEGSVGNDLIKNLAQGFAGQVYPINPKAESICGLTCYPNLTAVGQPIDLAVIAVPAAAVPQVLREAGQLKIGAAIVISAGFKEAGHKDLEDQIKEICQQYDIALIGPNCLGIINPEINLNAAFGKVMPKAGSVAFISQSGALCTAVIDYANKLNIGFSKFVSAGNKAVIDELAMFEYLQNDPQTKVITLYVEQLSQAQKLIACARKISRGPQAKPIILIKSGRTSAGASASASHTGALAGNDAAYDALFRQSGIIRADSVEQIFEYVQAFANNPWPRGRRVALITNAGGPGVLATDNLELAKLSESTTVALQAALPPAANWHNPIDVLGDAKADRYRVALQAAMQDDQVDSLLIILTPQSTTEVEETAKAIVEIKRTCPKPIVACFMGEAIVRPGVEILQAGGVAALAYPEAAAKALATLTDFAEKVAEPIPTVTNFSDVDKKQVAEIFARAKAQGQTAFPEAEAMAILQAYGFPVLQSFVATSAQEAQEFAQKLQRPLALKIVSPDILHKSDAGGIMLNVLPEQAAEKYEELLARVKQNRPTAKLTGVLLVEMAPTGGSELIVGSSSDPALGSMLMVGLGGILVEVFKDVAFGLPPLAAADAQQLLDLLKSKKILDGVRGQAALDVPALLEAIQRLSQLLVDFPEIKEMDINPLLVLPAGQGVKALDARVIIA